MDPRSPPSFARAPRCRPTLPPIAAPVFKTAETLEYDEKSVTKGPRQRGGHGAILDAAKPGSEGRGRVDGCQHRCRCRAAAQLDLKKRVVFQAVARRRLRQHGDPPLGGTMALVGRDDCLARIDRARTMAL